MHKILFASILADESKINYRSTLKHLFSILLLFFSITSFCQDEEIYKLTFSDTSNFRLTTYLNHQRPKNIFILDTTQQWYSERFWLDGLDTKSPQELKEMERDEHHPYNFAYLFRDSVLNRLISNNEKKSLRIKAEIIKSKKIDLKGKSYTTVTSSGNIKGFYFVTTEPLFTSDMKYAFIDLVVFYKDKPKQDMNETYFGHICVVYQKEPGNSWKKIDLVNYLIL